MEVQYFSYPFPPTGPDVDPLRLTGGAFSTPPAYVFAGAYRCTPPDNYKFDPRLEEVARDRQGNIVTALPVATYGDRAPTSNYVPVVSEIPVTGPSLPCQKPKSVDTLTKLLSAPPMPDGKYLAWLIIDPGAAVFPFGEMDTHPGVGLQSWGWYNRYLTAYLDGGAVPTADTTVMEGEPPMPVSVRSMVPQKLYYPRSMVIAPGAMPTMAAGKLGAGYDVLTAKRDAAGYSPVCEVWTYDTGMPLAAADLPRDAAMIEATFNDVASPLQRAATPLVFCLQVQVQP
jgi:hypothetical protein